MINMFKELIDDPFYIEYKKYDRCVLDYCILKCNDYNGISTHKEAILFFINKLECSSNPFKMKPMLIKEKELFKIPKDYEKERRNLPNEYQRPYWFLFLDPPHQTQYKIDDFIKINNILFPKGKDNLEIYDWNVDWSDYFDDGLEWWGARCTSIYDKKLDRIVIILASSTD